MTTITISRQFGSHGDTVAQLLCDRLGYRYFDKNLMTGLAVQSGLPAEKLVDLSEEKPRARTLVERLFATFASPLSDPGVWAASAEADAQEQLMVAKIRHLIQAAHAEGNVVIIGRGGQAVLRGLPGVLHVRLVAPLELRIKRHGERAGLAPEEAREAVTRRDQASVDYVKRFYKLDPTDPELYDLIINTDKVTPSTAADLIIKAITSLPAVDRLSQA